MSAPLFKDLKTNKNDKMRIGGSLSSTGWYRIATYTNSGYRSKSFIINVNTNYNHTNNMSFSCAVNITYRQANIKLLSYHRNSQTITQIRVVYDPNNILYHVEIYYSVNAQNLISTDIIVNRDEEENAHEIYPVKFENSLGTETVLDTIHIDTIETGWMSMTDQITFKRKDGIVYVRGESQGALGVGNGSYTHIAQLPKGYRPDYIIYFPWTGLGGDTTKQSGYIDGSGNVRLFLPSGQSTTYWSFFLSYPANLTEI